MRTGLQLALGLALVGAAGYAFVSVVGFVFTVPPYAAALSALTSVYLLVNIIGPGLFTAVEQETSRAVSASIAVGAPVRPVAKRAALLAAALFGGLVVVLAALWTPVLSRVLADRLGLLAALVLAGASAAAVYCVRGVLSGQQRFGRYAVTLYLEGGVRLLPCLALLALAVHAPDAYGLVFAAGSGVAGLALLPSLRLGGVAAVPGQLDGMRRSLLLLVTATLLTQAVANLAPVVVTYRLPDDLVGAGVFATTFVLARVPLFLFSPVQALLLPQLTRAATTGRLDVVRSRIRLVLLAVAAVGLPGAVAAALVGPWAVQVAFNAARRPPALTLGLLGLATVLMMVAQVLQPALVALGAQRTVTLAWVSGTAVFLALLAAPLPPVTAALAAQLAGPAVVVAVLGVALLGVLRRRAPART